MFENLTDRLQGVLQHVRGSGRLTAENVDSALIEVRKALIEADVSLQVIKLFLDRVRKSAVGETVVKGITPSQKFIEVVHKELVSLLGQEVSPLNLSVKPSIIMLLGLQGAGKTTTAAKLALYLKRNNKKVLLTALDLQRPAAIDQLCILGQSIEVEVYSDNQSKDVLEVAERAYKKAKDENFDIVIFDTAGRLQIDNDLMAELLLLDKKYKPKEKLLVIDSLIGQEASRVAATFNTQIGITGNILTKMDGDSRGGAALSIVEATKTKIKFLGLGEKIEPLEAFEPESIADRILGFADIVGLVKAAEEKIDKEEALALEKQLKKGIFNFEVFLKMQSMMDKLGNFSQMFGMMGLNSLIPSHNREAVIEEGQKKIKVYTYIIQSMTLKERQNPKIINKSRLSRIAKGSGVQEKTVNALLKEFEKMSQMMQILAPLLGGDGLKGTPNASQIMGAVNSAKKQEKQKRKGDSPFKGGVFLKF